MKLDWVRNEIARMRGQIRAREREIEMLRRAGIATAAAELLLVRMRAKVDDLCNERDEVKRRQPAGDITTAQRRRAGGHDPGYTEAGGRSSSGES